jgi:hypothetical protein
MTHVLHRQIGNSYPIAARSHSVTRRDSTGKE